MITEYSYLTITRIRVHPDDILDAILGARLSYGSDGMSDSYFAPDGQAFIGADDEKLCRKLLRSGMSGEDKFLQTIGFSCFVTGSSIFMRHLATYRHAVMQSTSMMHRTKKRGYFAPEDFCPMYRLTPGFAEDLDRANWRYEQWVAAGAKRNSSSSEWLALQNSLPMGLMYTVHWKANYAVLANQYRQRRHHRLGAWKDWLAMIELLPHSWLITREGIE